MAVSYYQCCLPQLSLDLLIILLTCLPSLLPRATSLNLSTLATTSQPCAPVKGGVCGSDLRPYRSLCSAAKAFALPATPGTCNKCNRACKGRTADVPSPASACPQKYLCPTPSWNSALYPIAKALFPGYGTKAQPQSPLCLFLLRQCQLLCSQVALPPTGHSITLPNGTFIGGPSYCLNQCYGCATAPLCEDTFPTFIPLGNPLCLGEDSLSCGFATQDNRGITVASAKCLYMQNLFQQGTLKYICWEKDL